MQMTSLVQIWIGAPVISIGKNSQHIETRLTFMNFEMMYATGSAVKMMYI